MIARILEQLRRDKSLETVHWPFFFSRGLNTMRRASVGKFIELILCSTSGVCFAFKARDRSICCFTSAKEPHLSRLSGIFALLPFARLASKRLVIQFHAAGIAEKI